MGPNLPSIQIYFADNLEILQNIQDEAINLVYIDPPFNTGKTQARTRLKTVRSDNGDRIGFGDRRYQSFKLGSSEYEDDFEDFLGFLAPRLKEAKRVLTSTGSLFFHLDYREIHYCKILLDDIFGRSSFINEIIWAYDYGARSKNKWPAKHDNILWYAKNPSNYTFNYAKMDRIPYMAPGLVGEEKAKKGKTPTDVWWHTIVSPNSREKTGYATQKPLGILERIVKIHSNPGDMCCDFFAGSGSFGEAAYTLQRDCILVDKNPQAMAVMKKRFRNFKTEWVNIDPETIPDDIYREKAFSPNTSRQGRAPR